MAASSFGVRGKNQHKRRNPCTNRPIYRDGRRERAVKVFTINQESRYLLVQGVPCINITDELLKLFSLYGAVEEYRIVDDLPAEEFTKNYWIKYEDLQAARTAKRKMDDHSFYGGFLHVTYAPEYESIQDTREKLQQRRMAVARRLRKLAQERVENDPEDCIETIASSSLVVPSEKPPGSVPSKAWGLPSDEPLKREVNVIQPQKLIAGCPSVSRDDPAPLSGQHEVIPSLPAPPQRLPPWQWNIPNQPEFPRLRTSHETLPVGFNPFPTVADYQQGNVGQHLAQPPPPPPPPITQLAPLGTFIGPQSPPSMAASSVNLCSADYATRDSEDGKTQYLSTGDRCKVKMKGCRSTRKSDAFQGESFGVCEQNPQDVGLGSGSDRQECTDGGIGLSEGMRPKLVARRRLGSQAANSSTQQSAGRHEDYSGTSAKACKPQFLPRVVSTRTKRSAASVEEPGESERSCLPVTGNASLDQTVSTIRQQMFQASVVPQTGANPISQLQATIIRSRNQERMGLLPRRPPVKRQRI